MDVDDVGQHVERNERDGDRYGKYDEGKFKRDAERARRVHEICDKEIIVFEISQNPYARDHSQPKQDEPDPSVS